MKNVDIHPEVIARIKDFKIEDTNLGFGKYVAPIMIQAYFRKGEWEKAALVPYGPLLLDPCAKVLHYGQEIFEGMKVFLQPDGSAKMFRPEKNAQRFNFSARRMAMPEIPEEMFLEACDAICAYCKNLVPKRLGESLYLRPFMIATEAGMGIKPANEFLFAIVASPSSSYFSGDAVKVYVERKEIRSAPGGIGAAKTGGNYAASLNSYAKTLKLGCDQTMWLDAYEHKYIEEMSGMNFFVIIDDQIITPALGDTILNGITRMSIIEIAKKSGMTVQERKISIDEILSAIQEGRCQEAFVCGTAAVVAPIASFMDHDESVHEVAKPKGDVSMKLREKLIAIQAGKTEAPEGWTRKVPEINF